METKPPWTSPKDTGSHEGHTKWKLDSPLFLTRVQTSANHAAAFASRLNSIHISITSTLPCCILLKSFQTDYAISTYSSLMRTYTLAINHKHAKIMRHFCLLNKLKAASGQKQFLHLFNNFLEAELSKYIRWTNPGKVLPCCCHDASSRHCQTSTYLFSQENKSLAEHDCTCQVSLVAALNRNRRSCEMHDFKEAPRKYYSQG